MGAIRRQAAATGARHAIDWGVAHATLRGEPVSGDCHLVVPFPNGALAAVVDGLGHGRSAADAAEAAVASLQSHCQDPVESLFRRCHESLRGTRGATLSMASFDAARGTLSWMGVGNVEGVVLRADRDALPARVWIRLFPGVVGHHMPAFRPVTTLIYPGDLLILFTDGVRADFLSEPIFRQEPQRMADGICSKHRKATDDSLVLVARYGRGLP
jgi:negative regulator of sigma-B (phosphoserine phosphatase)